MKTFALMFGFVPVFLAYSVNGPVSETYGYVFYSLLLIAVAGDICATTFRCVSRSSQDAVDHSYIGELIAATDNRRIEQVKISFRLFHHRGAA